MTVFTSKRVWGGVFVLATDTDTVRGLVRTNAVVTMYDMVMLIARDDCRRLASVV